MNVLPDEKRLEVLAQLVNGSSMRATERTTGVNLRTILRFLVTMGEGCERLHNRIVRGLSSPLVDMDEQHSWCKVRQSRFDPTKHDAATMGEQWTWTALCRTSKMVIAWRVGKRTQEQADAVVADVRARLAVMPQITTDGLALYTPAIAASMGPAAQYAQMVKRFSGGGSGDPSGYGAKFAPKHGVDFIERRPVLGSPDLDKCTTYAVERNNLTARQWNARLHRRTLAYSKKLENHRAAVSIFYSHFNLCWIPRNLRVTPAMAAGVTDHVWSLGEFMEAALSAPPCERPTAQPLAIPTPETTSRALPGDRGFLRAVGGGNAPKPPSSPVTPPAVAAASSGAVRPVAKRWEQLDLLAWRRPGVQMSLFGDLEPPPR